MDWRLDKPYNQLPPLPPPKATTETLDILKACIPARAALAELKQNRNQAYANKFLFPGTEIVRLFAEKASPAFDLKAELEAANKNLTNTRDLLLPRLISGKLSLDDKDIQFPPSMLEDAAAAPAEEDALAKARHV